jgi:hypothetical protein
MNRAQRRAAKKPVRIPKFKMRHWKRVEQGYESHAFATVANRDVPPSIVQEQTDRARAAWALLSRGQPAAHEEQATAWKLLAQVCNITRCRAEQIALANAPGSAARDIMLISLMRAESELRSMQERGEAGHNYTPSALALQIIPDLLDLHEQILSLSTTLQMQKALEAVLAHQQFLNNQKRAALKEIAQAAID